MEICLEQTFVENSNKGINIDGQPSTTTYSSKIELKPWHSEVARLLSIGYSIPQVAVQTGISVHELTSLVKMPEFKELAGQVLQEIKDSTCELRLRLELASQQALDTIIDLMHTGRSEMVRRMCSLDIIDRAGYGTVQKHELVQTVIIDDKRADLIIQPPKEIMSIAPGN